MSSIENAGKNKSKKKINNVRNKSAQVSNPETNKLLSKLGNLQIKNDSVNLGKESSFRPTNSQNGATTMKKGVIIGGNNIKKVQVLTSDKSSTKKNDPGTSKHPFPARNPASELKRKVPGRPTQHVAGRFEEFMTEYKRNLPETPKSRHSPRTKTTPKQEHKNSFPGTLKSPHSPITKTTPKHEHKNIFTGTPKSPHSPHSPITKTTPKQEHKRNLPGSSKLIHSPRTKTSPKQEHKRNLPGSSKLLHSPRTKISPKQEHKRNLPGSSKLIHSPRTRTSPKQEHKRNLPGSSKLVHSPRTRTSPKALPKEFSKAFPIVQVKQKSLRAAFESLNNSNFNNVKMQIIQSKICSDTQLPKCINQIFLKSMDNPKQIPLYVRMCKEISKSLQNIDQFRLHMTNKCKSEVAQFREQARPNDIQNRKMLTHRALPLGTIIGELYKAELLTWSTIMGFMQSLVDSNWISEGSVGLIYNLHFALGKSYKRDGGNNFILSGIDVLNEKCTAMSFSKSTCAKVQKMKELQHSVENNTIKNNPVKPSKIERPKSSDVSVSCIDIYPILATITIDNFDETLTQLKDFRRMSEEQIKANVKMLFIEGIVKSSTAPVCAKLLKSCYPEKSYVVKMEIQHLINEELKDVRKSLLVLQDTKHGENSTMEQRVYNLSMFIAELYKVGLVGHGVVFNHLQRLNDAHFRNEISVKLCCILLCYIGGKLEKDASRKVITAYIKRLGENINQFDSTLGDSIREVKELQLNDWKNNKPTVNKMEYSQDAELVSATKEQKNHPPAVANETETSNQNMTNVIRNFLESAKSSKELMSNIKALISPENINEVTIECFCEFIKIAASENIQHFNIQDLKECFEKLQSILNLYKCNVISLCPRTSLLIQDVLNLKDHF